MSFQFTCGICSANHQQHPADDGLDVMLVSGGLRKLFLFLQQCTTFLRPFKTSRSSKVIDFGANRKRVRDFLLVRLRHNNLVCQ